MDSKQFGHFLTSAREDRNISREELAERLHVSEKMVSLWETGKVYPELSMLHPLSRELGLSQAELLRAEKNPNGFEPASEEDELIEEMAGYADKAAKYRASNMTFAAISVLFVLCEFVCLLVNFLIERRFSWSLFPLGAFILLWLTLAPWFFFSRRPLFYSFCAFITASTAYLILIERLSPAKDWALSLGLPILLTAAFPALLILGLFLRTQMNRLYLTALSVFVLGVVLNLAINTEVALYLGHRVVSLSSILCAVGSVVAAAVLLIVGYVRARKSRI